MSRKTVDDAFLHEEAGAGTTDLALVEPDAINETFDGGIEIGVLEDDEGRLAAEFERQLLARAGGGAADDLADLRRAREGDLVDAVMLDDGSTRFRAALHDIDDALRHAGALADLGKEDRGERREFGGLEHHCAAGGEGGGDLPGQHQQREIPRDDLPCHACALHTGIFVRKGLRPPGVMQEMADGERHVDVAALADRLAVVE